MALAAGGIIPDMYTRGRTLCVSPPGDWDKNSPVTVSETGAHLGWADVRLLVVDICLPCCRRPKPLDDSAVIHRGL